MTIHADLSSFLGVKVKPVVTSFTSANVSTTDISGIPNSLPTKTEVLSELSEKLEERFEYKKRVPSQNKRPAKMWRSKTHEKKLQERYLNRSYVFDLLNNTHLQQFDSCSRPICHARCKFNCQAKFRYDPDILHGELQKWWGNESSNIARDAFLYDDLKDWSIRKEDGTYELRWFIAQRQVCRNFYLRARGMHHSHVQKLQNQILKEKRTFTSLNLDRYQMEENKPFPKKDDIVAWLSFFKKVY